MTEKKKIIIKPQPDFQRILKVLRREKVDGNVVFFELFADMDIQTEILKVLDLLEPEEYRLDINEYKNCWYTDNIDFLRLHIRYMYNLGYDYINMGPVGFEFPRKDWSSAITNEGERAYVQGADKLIADYSDFERYSWPDMDLIDYSPFEKYAGLIPEGMKVISGFGGILENVIFLLGYDGIGLLLYDKPDLVRDVFEQVGKRIIKYFKELSSIDSIGALVLGDDMGYKTGTMLSPEVYQDYLFPWYKKLVDTVHQNGKPVILHSCGNLKEVMEDIIDYGWDAKHSFEDVIEPVWEAKRGYGDRIALLGGFDMDKLCRLSTDQVRKHTRMLMDKCSGNGGWALGTGNSVANYVDIENFLTMLEEGYLYRNKYH